MVTPSTSLLSSQQCYDVVATTVISTVTEMTSIYAASISSFLAPSSTYSTAAVFKTSESLKSIKISELDERMHSTSTSRVIANPNVSIGSSITASMEESTILFASVAPVLLILFIAIAVSTIILLFIIWRRKNYMSSQIDRHGEVELKQNECYAVTKQQQYVQCINTFIQISMYHFIYRVEYAEVDQKQDVVLQQNEAYCTLSQVQQSNHQIQLQQNESYAVSRGPRAE